MRELTAAPLREYFRPNFWPNTPDILPSHCRPGGLPAFRSRLVLAATLTANYGIYGPAFELGENTALQAGQRRILNSEKYEIKQWDLTNPRQSEAADHPAESGSAQNTGAAEQSQLHFHATDNPSLICYSKRTADGGNTDSRGRQPGSFQGSDGLG